jgi:hypothetical protein
MYNSINNKFIYDNANVGFSFQYYSPLDRERFAKKLSKYLGKDVMVKESDNDLKFVDDIIYITPEYSGGFKMNKIDTGLMPYNEAIHVMLKCMNFINENGFTDKRTNMNIKLSLNESDLDLKYNLENINTFKYVLTLNENKIFDMWPSTGSEKQKIYQNRAIFIYPKMLYNSNLTTSLLEKMNPLEYKFPRSSYFGSDFSKVDDGYLLLKYAGGKNYQKKMDEAVELINYISEHLYKTLKNNWNYSLDEKRKVQRLLEDYKRVISSTKIYESFVHEYPDIELYVDLKRDKFLIEANYPQFRDKLFELIACCDMKNAIVNYDTNRKRLQIKEATIKKGFSLNDVDFFESRIEADVENCLFENCIIRNSNVNECEVLSNNDVKYSKVIECTYSGENNSIKSSYLSNSKELLINADLVNCIVENGNFTPSSSIDDKTELLNRRAK